jgi:hypothetical protein
MMLSNTLRTAVIASSLLAAGTLFGATDGDQGSTSTGTTTVSVTKTSEVKISGLEDIALAVQADGSATGTTSACIYRNGTGSYSLTANGDGAASSFSLSDGGSNVMPYTVTFDDGSGAAALTKNTALTGLSNADTLSTTCNGTTNATIAITVATADFSSAPAGDYTGTLTLIIAPE